jgi:hypothetical protein
MHAPRGLGEPEPQAPEPPNPQTLIPRALACVCRTGRAALSWRPSWRSHSPPPMACALCHAPFGTPPMARPWHAPYGVRRGPEPGAPGHGALGGCSSRMPDAWAPRPGPAPQTRFGAPACAQDGPRGAELEAEIGSFALPQPFPYCQTPLRVRRCLGLHEARDPGTDPWITPYPIPHEPHTLNPDPQDGPRGAELEAELALEATVAALGRLTEPSPEQPSKGRRYQVWTGFICFCLALPGVDGVGGTELSSEQPFEGAEGR